MLKKTLLKRVLFLPVWLFVLTACGQTKPAQQNTVYTQVAADADGTGKVYFGREIAAVMGAAGADWLERNNRNQEENTDLAISKIPLKPDAVVADIGAGTGYYTFRVAKKVPQGKVFAVDVQDEFVTYLNQKKKELHQQNVTVVKGTETSSQLSENSVDLAFMVDVYHELLYPHEVLQSLRKALKPGGKLLLLEYRAEDPAVAIKELHKMSVAQVNREMAANGFKLIDRKEFLPIQHFLLYQKVD